MFNTFNNFDEWLINYFKLQGIVASLEIRVMMRDAYEEGFVQGNSKAIESRVSKFLDSCSTREK